MREERELPFNSQIKKVKDKINKLVYTFEDDEFDTIDLSPPRKGGMRMTIRSITTGKVDEIKVLKYLAGIGEITILKEENNYIKFKLTEKFGAPPTVKVEISTTHHIIESFKEDLDKMMKAYGILVIFENKLRFFISSFLEEEVGPDWWESNVPIGVKNNIKTHRLNGWSKELPKQNIQYTDFKDLRKIISSNWKDLFEKVFKNLNHMNTYLEQIEIPRNTIAHSNVLSESMYIDLKNNTDKILNLVEQYES